MVKSIDDMLRERPVDPEALARCEEQLLEAVRAYRRQRLRAGTPGVGGPGVPGRHFQ